MSRIDLRRGIAALAALLLVPIATTTAAPSIATAASASAFANGATANNPVLWTALGNITGGSNGLCAAAGSGGQAAQAYLTFPAFTLPAGDTIDGVEITVDYETSQPHFIQLTNGGTTSGSEIGTQQTLPANDGPNTCDGTSFLTVGSPTNTLGATLAAADFNAGNVGVVITQQLGTVGTDPGFPPIDIDSVELTVYHSGANSAPTAEANGPYSVPEGGSVGLSSAGSSDPDGDPLTITWDLDDDGTFETVGASPTFSAASADGPVSQTVEVRVSDGSLSDTDTATVNITNVAPTIDSITVSAASIDEGDGVTVSGTFSDPGTGETYGGSAIWSDGASTTVSIVGDTFSTIRTFADDHPSTGTASDAFTVDVTIDDGDGGDDTATSPVVTVSNVAPSVDVVVVSAGTITETQSVTVSGSFSDPALGIGTETFSGTAVWSDGASTVLSVDGVAGSFSTSRNFPDDDPTGTPADDFTVDIMIDDDDLGTDTETSPIVTVENLPPDADAGPDQVIEWVDGMFVDLDATGSSDPGPNDTLTYSWSFVSMPAGSSASFVDPTAATPSFLPDELGTYEAEVTVTDDDSGSDTDSVVILVEDTTAPDVTAALVPITSGDDDDDDDDEGNYRVEFSCTDACDQDPRIRARLNGVRVHDGQIVSLEFDDDYEVEYDDGILEFEAPKFKLVVRCKDSAGNVGKAKVVLKPPPGGDDDDDDGGDDDDD